MQTKFTLLAAALVAFIGLLVVFDDSGDEEKVQSIYCDNVNIWNASGQDNGHPDYKGIYSEICK